ncbi:SecC motif-containing protein [Thalassospira sp. HJ]|uniref:YchJ family protein n=1 Tax=Thalassospira sp. HJ TaxID=1616823 RepID=UPI0005CEF3A9|nr:YchJ family protein [Thalassospira sp. HJ]KJE34785.1 SecC motif-containing protein [Thalassospira sp. HJ]
MITLAAAAPCPCGSLKSYGACCGKYHSGAASAESAEKLMRSRYCAFVLRDGAYLLSTLAEENRSGFDAESIAQDTTRWTGLEIVESVAGGVLDQTGIVEFIARFEENGKKHQLHERSNFERRDGKWFYVDGVFPGEKRLEAPAKAGRNDPCPCGSGKKFKKCCG